MKKLNVVSSLVALSILMGGAGAHAARPLGDLTDNGVPALAKTMGADGYVAVTLKKLAHPTLLYIDLDWLRSKGFEVPKEGLTPEFEQKLLDVLGWAGQLIGEPDSAFKSESHEAFADRYGGFGLGNGKDGNGGSGRAASEGLLQGKGLTRSTLVNPKIDIYHSSGSAVASEGIMETLASQVADHELPSGANRVVALIATGTETSNNGGHSTEPRVLIFREDPIRPAHFVINEANDHLPAEQRRVKWMNQQLADLLPQKPGATFTSQADRMSKGLVEFFDRLGDGQAYSYARGLHHGAFTPSNLELDGKAIDFGSYIQYLGYPKASRVYWIGPFGDNTMVYRFIREFLQNVKANVPAEQKSAVMDPETGVQLFAQIYSTRLNLQMAALAGFPQEYLEKLTPGQLSDLGKTLLRIAQAGNEQRIDASHGNPGKTGTYDIPKILSAMSSQLVSGASVDDLLKGVLQSASTAGLSDVRLRGQLVNAYVAVLKQVEQAATADGVAVASLRRYVQLATELRNRKITEIMRGDSFWEKYYPMIQKLSETNNASEIRQQLNTDLANSRHTFRDAAPLTLVLEEKRAASGDSVRKIFDLKSGSVKIVRIGHRPARSLNVCRDLFNSSGH